MPAKKVLYCRSHNKTHLYSMEKGLMQHTNEKKLIFWNFVRDFRNRSFSDRTHV